MAQLWTAPPCRHFGAVHRFDNNAIVLYKTHRRHARSAYKPRVRCLPQAEEKGVSSQTRVQSQIVALIRRKCDEAKPACGRCARLRIECSGAGQQRFKFHNTTVHRLPPHCRKDRSVVLLELPAAPVNSFDGFLLSSPAANRHEAIVSRLASALEVRDPRYDLSVYGAFLFDIPRRIGRSPALDAAAEAFTASLPLILSAPRSATAPPAGARPTTTILSKYGTALYALRASLSDPRKVATPDTLCALYLIVICQGWLHDDGGPSPNHGEAISMILQAMKSREGLRDDFEQKIMSTLCFVVVRVPWFEAVFRSF